MLYFDRADRIIIVLRGFHLVSSFINFLVFCYIIRIIIQGVPKKLEVYVMLIELQKT